MPQNIENKAYNKEQIYNRNTVPGEINCLTRIVVGCGPRQGSHSAYPTP